MPVVLDRTENIEPGTATVLESVSQVEAAAVVFEDDGESGYFYAREGPSTAICDALSVYTVAGIRDRTRVRVVQIGWSPSGRQAVLILDGQAQAVFDFERKKGWCRTAFPPAPGNGTWSVDGHAWEDSCLGCFA
jgi:hypothetical protein